VAVTEDDTELDAAEALRWCFRHQAELAFIGGDGGGDFVKLEVATAHGGFWARVDEIDGPQDIDATLVALVTAARAALRME
jgi:hypothetical protein